MSKKIIIEVDEASVKSYSNAIKQAESDTRKFADALDQTEQALEALDRFADRFSQKSCRVSLYVDMDEAMQGLDLFERRLQNLTAKTYRIQPQLRYAQGGGRQSKTYTGSRAVWERTQAVPEAKNGNMLEELFFGGATVGALYGNYKVLLEDIPKMSKKIGVKNLATGISTIGMLDGGARIAEGMFAAGNDYDRTSKIFEGATIMAGSFGGMKAGAALGSLFGPVGAAAGAGLGYLAGEYLSDPISEFMSGGKLGAMKNAAISSEAAARLEKFKQEQEELAKIRLDEKFGDIALSAEQLSQVVAGLFDPSQTARIYNANAAINELGDAYQSLQQGDYTMDKSLWMASTRHLDAGEQSVLKEQTVDYGQQQLSFLREKQYAGIEAIHAITGDSDTGDILIDALGKKYEAQIEETENLIKQLDDEINKSLQDGIISESEKSKIDEIMTNIENQRTLAEDKPNEFKAGLDGIPTGSIKSMNWESFQNVITTGIGSADEQAAVLDNLYASVAPDLNADERRQLLLGKAEDGNEGLYAEKKDLYMNVAETMLDEFTDRFQDELGESMTSIEPMYKKIKAGQFGIEDFKEIRDQGNALRADEETRAAVGEYVDSMSDMTQKVLEIVSLYEGAGLNAPREAQEYLRQMDFYAYLADDKALNWFSDNANGVFQSENYNYLAGAAQQPVASSQETGGTATVPTELLIDGEKVIEEQINITAEDFGIPEFITAPVDVYVTGHKIFGAAPPTLSPLSEYRGGIIAPAFAEGGYVHGGAQLITVAEEGTPEAIIPLGKHRRKRALQLFNQVGGYLEAPGFSPKGFAAGGIVGGSIGSLSGSGSSMPVAVEVGGVEIKVEAKDGQSLVETIRENKEAISEEIAGVFNAAFKGQFANTPAAGGAGFCA
ncbi:hypothetical protein V1225_01470 [Emergencia sp. JLR.KK010]|uniref:hypothetical protein n=1 Tax=Emergencia sp. JLR.KK010 TaxID=3114296 RepID=UPI0030D23A2C